MFASMLGLFLALFLLCIILIAIFSAAVSQIESGEKVSVKANSILHITLDQPVVERGSNNPFEQIDFPSLEPKIAPGMNDILKAIDKASKDDNIKGIFLELNVPQLGMAQAENIRQALVEFKKSKKFIIGYGEEMSQRGYYLASVADTLYLNPEGMIALVGMRAQMMFFKGTLAKLEIEPQVIRHGKYKTAAESFVNEKMSDENREQIGAFVDDIWNNVLAGISSSRKIPVETLNRIADSVLVRNAHDAVRHNMIDKVAYYDEVTDVLKRKSGLKTEDKLNLISLSKYSKAPAKPSGKGFAKDKIAVIYCTGPISTGKGNDENIGSTTISEAIRKARLDKNVKAIVLRVNSPGGSAVASDIILREVVLAKKEKPVVVSMSDVAASGGYYISCAADTIVAEATTITGSIGVIGLLMNGEKMLKNKLGITTDAYKTNPYADLGSFARPLTESEKQIIKEEIGRVYDVFTKHVAEGRTLDQSYVDSIGQGRVWSGVDAKQIGLVDVLGGIHDAVEIASSMAKTDHYRIWELPEQKKPLDMLLELSGDAETAMTKKFLGENYKVYKAIKEMQEMEVVQMRMTEEVEIE